MKTHINEQARLTPTPKWMAIFVHFELFIRSKYNVFVEF